MNVAVYGTIEILCLHNQILKKVYVMAIKEPTKRLDTTSSIQENDRHIGSSLRRRPNVHVAADDPLLESDSNSLESESSIEDSTNDQNGVDLIGNHYGRVAIEEQQDESLIEGKENEAGVEASALAVKFTYRASTPAHRKIRESPLSSDAIFKQSHAGLFNLCIVVLVAVNSRLIIENLMKYGWLIKPGFWFSQTSLRDWPLFMCCLSLSIFPLAAFLVEKLVQRKSISESVAVFSHVVITTVAISYPVLVILRCDSAVQSGATLMLLACIVWLKLVSYAHTNYDLRALAKSLEKGEDLSTQWNMDYCYDVNFKSLTYFMIAPTLCYQPSYPRTPFIRKGWVLRQLIKLVIFTGFMGFMVEQYINPIVQNSQHPLKGNLLYAIERVLKLSLPNLYVWLCMFYCLFHLCFFLIDSLILSLLTWFGTTFRIFIDSGYYQSNENSLDNVGHRTPEKSRLNILAELLCFGDREFYKDWWNAKTVEEYWRMWNMPVHKWMVRHIYFPCLRNGLPKGVAVVIAFFVSAIFHELCIAVPCHIFKFWAFIGIMFQVPLVIMTNYLQNKFQNSMVGNMVFWCFFCILGQPMSVLLYYHDVMNRKASAR